MSRSKKPILLLALLAVVCGLSAAWAADAVLNENYNVMAGLNGRGFESCPICHSDSDCTGGGTCMASPVCLSEMSAALCPLFCSMTPGAGNTCASSGWSYSAETGLCMQGTPCCGQSGIADFVNVDKSLIVFGSIQATFDDGRSDSCQRHKQVYETVDRSALTGVPGETNSFLAVKIPSLCGGTKPCRFSTPFAAPASLFSVNETLDENTKNSVAVEYPKWLDGSGKLLSDRSYYDAKSHAVVASHIFTVANYDYNLPDNLIDTVNVTQYVYRPEGQPYFGVTWSLQSAYRTYNDVEFWHVADTFTAGSDFGYGYLCNVTNIAGGTGGSAFFQGTIALTPSDLQYENFWGKVFSLVINDSGAATDSDVTLLSAQNWANPLSGLAKGYTALSDLEDNAIAQHWVTDRSLSTDRKLSISPTPVYISMIWTFDDPILRSSYGSARSLFTISPDDMGYIEDGTFHTVKPLLFDVNYDPNSWRGKVATNLIPGRCSSDSDCKTALVSDTCLETLACKGEAKCPRYCAMSYCGTGGLCPSGQTCIFGFCKTGPYWETQSLEDTPVSERKIFTYTPDGTRIWLTATDDVASTLNAQFKLYDEYNNPDLTQAKAVIAWTRGEIDTQRVISRNESNAYDLFNPTQLDASGATIKLLRERYDTTAGNNWLLGDIAHAEPVYIGMRPQNGWSDKKGAKPYSQYYNSKDYQNRHPMLLVSANDGMLHAYDATNGSELWAFVPWDVLPNLVELSKPYYERVRTPTMDLTPVVHDAYNPAILSWRTVLLVGSRGGGDHYWALDITPPSGGQSPVFLWGYGDSDLGLTYSQPTTGRFQATDGSYGERWLTFFGSGYAAHQAAQMRKTGYFYAVDLFTTEVVGGVGGAVEPKLVAKIPISGLDPHTGLAPATKRLYGLTSYEDTLPNNVLSSPTVADIDNDGYEDAVYVGDLVGHLLRFTFDKDTLGTCDSSGSCTAAMGQVLFNTFMTSKVGGGETQLDDYKMKIFNKRLGQGVAQSYEYTKYPRPVSTRPVIWRTTDPDEKDPNQIKTTFMGTKKNLNQIMVYFGTGKYDAFYDSFDEYKRCQNGTYADDGTCVTTLIDNQEFFAVIDRVERTVDGEGKILSTTIPIGDDKRVPWSSLLHNYVCDTATGLRTVVSASGSGGGTCATDLADPTAGDGTNGCHDTTVDRLGWHLTLASSLTENRGEKVITEPALWKEENTYRSSAASRNSEWVVFFTTFTPNMQGTCDIRKVNDAGGGFLMTLDAECGTNPYLIVQDVTQDSLLNSADQVAGMGYAGQKFTGSILSRVDVDPYSKSVFVKTGPDQPVMRVQIAGLPSLQSAATAYYRIK